MPLYPLPSVGELWMSVKIKACEFIEEVLTVLVIYRVEAGGQKQRGKIEKRKVCWVKTQQRTSETARVFELQAHPETEKR